MKGFLVGKCEGQDRDVGSLWVNDGVFEFRVIGQEEFQESLEFQPGLVA